MGETVAEIIARLKAQKNSQALKPSESKPIPKSEDDELEELDEEDEPEAKTEEKTQDKGKETAKEGANIPESKQPELTQEEKIAMEMEMLQNNGRFRAEFLFLEQQKLIELREIKQGILGLAEILALGNEKNK